MLWLRCRLQGTAEFFEQVIEVFLTEIFILSQNAFDH
jgi:hypothetical protein